MKIKYSERKDKAGRWVKEGRWMELRRAHVRRQKRAYRKFRLKLVQAEKWERCDALSRVVALMEGGIHGRDFCGDQGGAGSTGCALGDTESS